MAARSSAVGGQQSGESSGRARSWAACEWAAPGLVAAAGLLTPLAVLWLSGVSLIGGGEESVGYRYFYSLRMLYTPDERPWLPQGQLMSVVHLLTQLLLTSAGHSPYTISPRIEWFAWINTVLPHLITGLVVAWAVRPLPTLTARLLVAVGLVAVSTDAALVWGYHLLVPDYHAWMHPLAMATLGCCLRFIGTDWRPSWGWLVGVGVLAGLLVALKLSMVALAIPMLLLFLARFPAWPARLTALAAVSALAGAVFLLLTWLTYAGSVQATGRYLTKLLAFGADQGQAGLVSIPGWWLTTLTSDPHGLTRFVALAPVVLGVSAALIRPRRVAVAFLIGTLFAALLVWARPGWTTLVEASDLALVATVVWAAAVAPVSLRRQAARWLPAILVLVSLVAVGNLTRAMLWWQPFFAEADAIERQLDAFTGERPGRVAVLILDNHHRVHTRDSAIFKGGTDAANSNFWGVSPFVQELVPERHYFYPAEELPMPVDLTPFRYALFVSLETDRLENGLPVWPAQTFGVSWDGFACPLQIARPYGDGTQWACRRVEP